MPSWPGGGGAACFPGPEGHMLQVLAFLPFFLRTSWGCLMPEVRGGGCPVPSPYWASPVPCAVTGASGRRARAFAEKPSVSAHSGLWTLTALLGGGSQPCVGSQGTMWLEPRTLSRRETDLYLDHQSVRMGVSRGGCGRTEQGDSGMAGGEEVRGHLSGGGT